MNPAQVVRRSTRRPVVLRPSSFPSGGEGVIYEVEGEPTSLAKMYRKPTAERARKLAAMVANPPGITQTTGHCPLAWPSELLCLADNASGSAGTVVGFLMPRAAEMRPIIDFYTPSARRTRCPPGFNYLYLHRTARNLAGVFHSVHTKGYVVGDVKESNILVSNTALVTLVDADSFQVRSGGTTFRCPVKTPEFTPPELQAKNPRDVDRTPLHDLFGLAVLIFQLLMEGAHPFSGVYKGPGEPLPVSEYIAHGDFAFNTCSASGSRSRVSPPRLAPPFAMVYPKLQGLFQHCFLQGHRDPSMRPSALTWQSALEEAEQDLQR